MREVIALIVLVAFSGSCVYTTKRRVHVPLSGPHGPKAKRCALACRARHPNRINRVRCYRRCPGAEEGNRALCELDQPDVVCGEFEKRKVSVAPVLTVGIPAAIVLGLLLLRGYAISHGPH